MDPGWRLVPQRPAQVCCFNPVPDGLLSSVCCGYVTALDHHGFTAEVVQRAARPCGQAQDWTWGPEGNGAEEWVLVYLLHCVNLQKHLELTPGIESSYRWRKAVHFCMDCSRSSSDDPQLCALTGGCLCRSMGVMHSGVVLINFRTGHFLLMNGLLCLERLLRFRRICSASIFFVHRVLHSLTSAAPPS